MAKSILYVLFIILGIGFTLVLGSVLMLTFAFGGFDKDYSVSELKENFEKRKMEIYEVRSFFRKIVPDNKFVEIEFKDDKTLNRLGIKDLDNPNKPIFLTWNLSIDSQETDSIINSLGWTKELMWELKKKLDNANCIQIQSGEPTKIGFQRSGLGMYSFNIFDQPIPDSLKQIYNDRCQYILATDLLVLEYGGGAVGAQCFYNLE